MPKKAGRFRNKFAAQTSAPAKYTNLVDLASQSFPCLGWKAWWCLSRNGRLKPHGAAASPNFGSPHGSFVKQCTWYSVVILSQRAGCFFLILGSPTSRFPPRTNTTSPPALSRSNRGQWAVISAHTNGSPVKSRPKLGESNPLRVTFNWAQMSKLLFMYLQW